MFSAKSDYTKFKRKLKQAKNRYSLSIEPITTTIYQNQRSIAVTYSIYVEFGIDNPNYPIQPMISPTIPYLRQWVIMEINQIKGNITRKKLIKAINKSMEKAVIMIKSNTPVDTESLRLSWTWEQAS